MEPVARAKGISLALDVPAGLPEVPGDPGRVRPALINLMANAIHYTPQDGSVDVRA